MGYGPESWFEEGGSDNPKAASTSTPAPNPQLPNATPPVPALDFVILDLFDLTNEEFLVGGPGADSVLQEIDVSSLIQDLISDPSDEPEKIIENLQPPLSVQDPLLSNQYANDVTMTTFSSTNNADSSTPAHLENNSTMGADVVDNWDTDVLQSKICERFINRNPQIQDFQSRSKDDQIRLAFFDLVVNVPIKVDGLFVPRKAWAKAFYETDVIKSAKCLFQALFSNEEMKLCTLNGKKETNQLCPVKKLAILRASAWMKNKNQDPYYFDAWDINEHNCFPTKEEHDKIEKKVFTEKRSQEKRKLAKNESSDSSSSFVSSTSDMDGDGDDGQRTQEDEGGSPEDTSGGSYSGISPPNFPSGTSSVLQEDFDELQDQYYYEPEGFLQTLLPNRTDICIDGYLVPAEKWKAASDEAQKDIVKGAWILFQTLFTDEEIIHCTLNGKKGKNELCPVKKLAIMRAVQWMRVNGHTPEVMEFDSNTPGCNLLPSKDEMKKIETKVFTEKRYQYSRQLSSKIQGDEIVQVESITSATDGHSSLQVKGQVNQYECIQNQIQGNINPPAPLVCCPIVTGYHISGIKIDKHCWAQATMQGLKYDKRETCKCLFDYLVSDDEIRTGTTISGRNDATSIPTATRKIIMRTMSWMCRDGNQTGNPYKFQVKDVEKVQVNEDDPKIVALQRAVFIDYRSNRKRQLDARNNSGIPKRPKLVSKRKRN